MSLLKMQLIYPPGWVWGHRHIVPVAVFALAPSVVSPPMVHESYIAETQDEGHMGLGVWCVTASQRDGSP